VEQFTVAGKTMSLCLIP